MTHTSPSYDEEHIIAELATWPRDRRVAFACAAVERLIAVYEWFTAVADQGDPAALRSALDLAWSIAASHSAPTTAIDEARDVAESLVPDDQDDNWTILSPLAQNAAAGVAYALRAWLVDDPREAMWAARQLHEAADYLVQLIAPEQTYEDDASSAPMSIALNGIEAALRSALSTPTDELRKQAVTDGQKLRSLLEPEEQP
jgi:uncharacterized protein YjaG (DUF416 family)